MSSGGQTVDCHRRARSGGRNSRRSTTELEDYVRRAETDLLAGNFADAFATYCRGIVAFVVPTRPDTPAIIDAAYAERLVRENSVAALTGASFARWVFLDYTGAIEILDVMLAIDPDDVFGTLFRGSSRLLHGVDVASGLRDLDRAIELDPDSPDVRFVVADAYTYGSPDSKRAFAEATRALDGGLDTPRVHAILAAAHLAFGDHPAAGKHFARHLDLVTAEPRTTAALEPARSLSLDLVPGRVYEVPLPARAGAAISVATSSSDVTDSIAALFAPDGSPVTGGDDEVGSFAAVAWEATVTGVYRLRVASFEAVETGSLRVTRH